MRRSKHSYGERSSGQVEKAIVAAKHTRMMACGRKASSVAGGHWKPGCCRTAATASASRPAALLPQEEGERHRWHQRERLHECRNYMLQAESVIATGSTICMLNRV